MKKSLVITLALVFVLGIAGTAFAAANPFVDVPAKHWAYDAVAKLANAGIVDGYNDGTFRGDKTMTRYEMAQIVAKAMVKSEKADAETKALVDKLAVEFNAELQNLGVRVAKLEANQSNLKFGGTANIRYRAIDYDSKASDVNAYYRLRLEGVAKVDDKTTFGMRFVNQAPDSANFKNDTWNKFGSDSTNGKIDRVFVATKIGVVNTTIGRQALAFDPYSITVDSGAFSYDGVKVGTKAGVFDVVVNHGRIADGVSYKDADGNAIADFADFASMDIDSVNVTSKYGKLNYGLGYAFVQNNDADLDLMKYYLGHASYLFDSKFSLGAEYAKNDEADEHNDFWAVRATYGDQALKAKGQNNLVLQYSDLGAASVFNRLTTLDTPGDVFHDYKVFDANYNYAFSKNMNGQLQYVKVDDKDDDTKDYNYYKVTLNVAF